MDKTMEKDSVIKKAIHYGTIIVIFILIIPASINSFYFPIIFLLFCINLFNSLYSRCKGNAKRVFVLTLACAVPLVIYLILK